MKNLKDTKNYCKNSKITMPWLNSTPNTTLMYNKKTVFRTLNWPKKNWMKLKISAKLVLKIGISKSFRISFLDVRNSEETNLKKLPNLFKQKTKKKSSSTLSSFGLKLTNLLKKTNTCGKLKREKKLSN